MARKSKLLGEFGNKLSLLTSELDVEELPIKFLIEFKEDVKYGLFDYRRDIAYQPLENVIMITTLGLLANCDEWTQIYEFACLHEKWLSQFLDLKFGIPSISTIKRIMTLIDTNELEEVCVTLVIKKLKEIMNLLIESSLIENNENEKDVIAYDGKVCRSSSRKKTKEGEIKPVNAMTAFNVTKDICLATKFIEDKTNEIPTGPELIKLLDLTNTISTFDALNTQKETIKAIIDKGGDYVAALKGNHQKFYNEVVDYFNDEKLFQEAYKNCSYEEKEKAHGCQEKRIYILTEDIKWFEEKDKWKNLNSIGICIREYEVNGIPQKDIRYYISSLKCIDIKDFSRAVRDEWGIENNLHWHLDVTFKEDKNRTMDKKAQANLNILRKFNLNILKLIQPLYNRSLKLMRFIIGQNFEEEIKKVLLHLDIEELKNLMISKKK